MASIAVIPMTGVAQTFDIDDYMWYQDPDPNGWDVNATRTNIMANDFECNLTGLIVGVTLWGSWKNNIIGSITNIHLSIHSDIPVNLNASPPITYSRPGIRLWEYDTGPISHVEQNYYPQGWYDPSIMYWAYNDHIYFYRYDITIPDSEAFLQTSGNIYWLDVQVMTVGGNWGWKTSKVQVLDDAVWGLWDRSAGEDPDLIEWHELIEPVTNVSLDMSFGVITKAASPPTTTTVTYTPSKLNLKSQGRWVTVKIIPPKGYGVEDIDISSLGISVEGTDPQPWVPVDWGMVPGKSPGEPDPNPYHVMAKFDRSDLEDILVPGTNNMVLSGQLKDGTGFVSHNDWLATLPHL